MNKSGCPCWKHASLNLPSTYSFIQSIPKFFNWYSLKSTGICYLLFILTVITLVLVQTTGILHLDYCYSSLTGRAQLQVSQNTAAWMTFHNIPSLLKNATSCIPTDSSITCKLLTTIYTSWPCTAHPSESIFKTY